MLPTAYEEHAAGKLCAVRQEKTSPGLRREIRATKRMGGQRCTGAPEKSSGNGPPSARPQLLRSRSRPTGRAPGRSLPSAAAHQPLRRFCSRLLPASRLWTPGGAVSRRPLGTLGSRSASHRHLQNGGQESALRWVGGRGVSDAEGGQQEHSASRLVREPGSRSTPSPLPVPAQNPSC